MYSCIIPEILTVETRLNSIAGFYLSENFEFYEKTEHKSKFHYNIECSNFEVPEDYDFRSGYFTKNNGTWYYERNLFPLSLKFKFFKDKFAFNWAYSKVPVEIGHIFPVGRHIADIISTHLFLKNFLVIRGCAYEYKDKITCISAPGFNGKTTLMHDILKKGGRHIAEDKVIVDMVNGEIYPTAPDFRNFEREENTKIKKVYIKNWLTEPRKIDEMLLVQNSTSENQGSEKCLLDYVFLNSLVFLKSPLIRAYISEEKLTHQVVAKINQIETCNIKYRYKNIRNFDYGKILGDKLG